VKISLLVRLKLTKALIFSWHESVYNHSRTETMSVGTSAAGSKIEQCTKVWFS